jgi:excisionase family DNA binding protein
MRALVTEKPLNRRAFTIPEVAQMLCIHKVSVYRHVHLGELRLIAKGGRMMISDKELDRFLGNAVEYAGIEN